MNIVASFLPILDAREKLFSVSADFLSQRRDCIGPGERINMISRMWKLAGDDRTIETLQLAILYLDMFLDRYRYIPANDRIALPAGCIFLATKYEIDYDAHDIHDKLDENDELVGAVRIEKILLEKVLNYRVNLVTSYAYINEILHSMPDKITHDERQRALMLSLYMHMCHEMAIMPAQMKAALCLFAVLGNNGRSPGPYFADVDKKRMWGSIVQSGDFLILHVEKSVSAWQNSHPEFMEQHRHIEQTLGSEEL